jgi:beta-mannosidase
MLQAQQWAGSVSGAGRRVYSLNGEDWMVLAADSGMGERLGYYGDHFPVTQAISAKVPGDVNWDLMRAGVIPDIFIGMNAKKTYPYARKEWWYRKTFTLSRKEWTGKRIRLHFSGVDYAAKVWLDGELLGEHKGQFTPFEFEMGNMLDRGAKHTLVVLIEAAPGNIIQKLFLPRSQENRQDAMNEVSGTLGYWKSRTMTGWDWGTPLWSMGIWQDVALVGSNKVYLDDLSISPQTSFPYKKAEVNISLAIDASSERTLLLEYGTNCINGRAPAAQGRQLVRVSKGRQTIRLSLPVPSPALWWPNGYGKQNLYCLTIRARDANTGESLDQCKDNFGIRELRITENPDDTSYKKMMWYSLAEKGGSGIKDVPKDSLPRYQVEINGRKIFLHGGNWIPADLLFGRPGKKEYEHLIRMAALANYNVFRVWGGGLIEKQVFYNLCDRYGILLYQEMPNAGALPLETKEILAHAGKEQRKVIPLLINHPSLFRYGFGNELYVTGQNSLQVRQFESICAEMDPGRAVNGADPVCEYQRHGPHWFNIPAEYGVYNSGYPLTVGPDNPVEWSEYGASGASSVETLRKITRGGNNWPVPYDDSIWRWHNASGAYTSSDWLKPEIYRSLFGELPGLETEVRASQFAQAEGLRYANQANRRAKWHRSGCFMWTFNEPWPNAAHGSIVEYYGAPKMAFYYTRRSYAQVDVSATYHSICLHPGDTLRLPVFATNARPENITASLRTIIEDLRGKLYYKGGSRHVLRGLSSHRIDSLQFITDKADEGKVMLVRFELRDLHKKLLSSETYTFGVKSAKGGIDEGYLRPMLHAPAASVRSTVQFSNKLLWGEDSMSLYKVKLKNVSQAPALFVEMKSRFNPSEVYFPENFLVLLPGEEREVEVVVAPGVKGRLGDQDILIDAWNQKRSAVTYK